MLFNTEKKSVALKGKTIFCLIVNDTHTDISILDEKCHLYLHLQVRLIFLKKSFIIMMNEF
jgi:hypothetical protein